MPSNRLADERGALRRLARLVAHAPRAEAVFAAVAAEVGQLLDADVAVLGRYERKLRRIDFVGSWGVSGEEVQRMPALALGASDIPTRVFETGAPARLDGGGVAARDPPNAAPHLALQFMVGAPINIEGELWGCMLVASNEKPLPGMTEHRLAEFVDLVAVTIANAEARTHLGRYAQEQAALRRVATLVAQGTTPTDVFAEATNEIARLLNLPIVTMVRFEEDATATVIAAASDRPFAIGTRLKLDGPSVIGSIRRTGRPARIESYAGLPGEVAAGLREAGAEAGYGVPIVVNGKVWGAIAVVDTGAHSAAEVQARLAEFTELVATAIANAATRAELVASRARIVLASDEGRRRLERDLHDTIQQRLIALAFDAQRLHAKVPGQLTETRAGLERLAGELESVLDEVQELSRGLHPILLSRGGLLRPLRDLARRSPIPVEVQVATEPRPPETVETAAYYIVSEALTNAIKHSRATRIAIEARSSNLGLRLVVRDDGAGGAAPSRGSGLIGMADRVDALGGTLDIDSSPNRGTVVTVVLPSPEG